MDDQPMRDMDKTIDKGKDTVQRAFTAAEAKTSETIDKAKTLARNAGETISEVKTMARNAGEQAWSTAADVATTAQDLAHQARDQAAAVSDTLYEEGARAGEYLRRNVNEYPMTALLVAGAIGYMTAYLMHASWSSNKKSP